MGRVPIVLGMILLVAGGGAVGYTLTQKAEAVEMPREQSEAMKSAQEAIGFQIKGARDAIRDKAKTLIAFPTLKNGLFTNADTLAEQLKEGDIGLAPAPDQVIELGQIEVGKTPVVLLRQPTQPGAKPSAHDDKGGDYLDLDGDKLIVTTVVTVPSAYDSFKGSGFVGVAQTINLHDPFAKLAATGFVGDFGIGDKSTPIGGTPDPKAELGTATLSSEPAAHIRYVKPAAQAKPATAVLAGGAGGAVFGLVLVIVGMMGGKKREDGATAPITSQTPTQISAPQPAQSLSSAAIALNPGAGQMIGRWEVVRRLGSGGMADVYLARAKGEAGFEKLVALKVMHAHLARNARAVEHFLDEARLAANVHHPNVVAIQDLGKIGEEYAIVMEYVDGVDLERLLMSARTNERPVPVDVGLGILTRICDGLNAAHKASSADGTPLGIIHRDVKSANVLVSKQGGVKVVDFGIAKAATQSHLTQVGETKGTPSMMAPEQRVGELVDVRADVYSVAAVGYEIMTNHGVNLDLAALAHLGVENWPHLPLPSSLRSALPRELDDLLLGAMAFERDKRPADCEVFGASFEVVMKKHSLAATDKDIGRWVESELASVQAAAAEKDLANKQTG